MAARVARRSPGTIQTWMLAGKIRSMCTIAGHLTVVYWPDVYDLTFTEARRVRACRDGKAAA
jgi:hypothetical protein